MVKLDDPKVRQALDAEGGDDAGLARMSFGDHLDELRKRLFKAVLAVVVAVLAMIPFHDQVMGVIIEPYRILWTDAFRGYVADFEAHDKAGQLVHPVQRDMLAFCRENQAAILDGTFPKDLVHVLPTRTGFVLPYELVAVEGIEDFWTFMMASMIFAIVLASPVVIWQAWAFVAAGLYARERQVFYRYFPFMMGLLAAGILFGYFLAVPMGLGFLIRLQVRGLVSSMLSVGNYFTFLFALTAAMGLIFQLPLVMAALQKVGLVRHRTYVKNWRLFVLIIFILAAVLTPPDPFSMMIMATPTLLLYVLGLVLTKIGSKHEPDDLVAGLDRTP